MSQFMHKGPTLDGDNATIASKSNITKLLLFVWRQILRVVCPETQPDLAVDQENEEEKMKAKNWQQVAKPTSSSVSFNDFQLNLENKRLRFHPTTEFPGRI